MRIDRPPPGEELNEGEVTEARVASSLILLRDSPKGPEVLLVQRNPEQRFMGGAWVFPGGSVHPEDGDELGTARRELEEEAGIAMAPEAELVRYSRWITPAEVKVRFDTHFFVAEAPEGAEATPDGGECVGARWLRPQDALDAGQRDELMLVFPTIKHLEQLAEHASVADTLERARERKVMPVQPRVLTDGGVARVLLPGEPGYDS
jgi:8-oxo-dGTP pyrophosphatase MutT (NUDIX family)